MGNGHFENESLRRSRPRGLYRATRQDQRRRNLLDLSGSGHDCCQRESLRYHVKGLRNGVQEPNSREMQNKMNDSQVWFMVACKQKPCAALSNSMADGRQIVSEQQRCGVFCDVLSVLLAACC